MQPVAPLPAPQPEQSEPKASLLARLFRGRSGLVLRLAFTVLPFAWLAQRVRLDEVASNVARVGAQNLGLATIAFGLAYVPATLRWKLLMRAYGANETPPFFTLLRHQLVCAYFNVLPSGVAGDFVRAQRVREWLPNAATSFAIVFIERIAGLIGLLLLAALASLASLYGEGIDSGLLVEAFVLTTALALGASFVLFGVPYLVDKRPKLGGLLQRLALLGPLLLRIPKPQSAWGLVKAVGLSLGTQGCALFSLSLLLRPVVDVSQLLACMQVAPLAILLTYIPITPGGVAQREAIYAYLFAFANVAESTSVAVSLSFFFAQMTVAAIGGVVHLGERLATGRA